MATKKCPFCAEEIQEEAFKCRHCHESLTPLRAEIATTAGGSLSKAANRKAEQAAAPAFTKDFFKKYWPILTVLFVVVLVACAVNGAIANSLVGPAALFVVLLFLAMFVSPWRYKIVVALLWCCSIVLYSFVYGLVPAETKAKDAADEQARAAKASQEQDQRLAEEKAQASKETHEEEQRVAKESAQQKQAAAEAVKADESKIYAGDKCMVTEDTPIADNFDNYKLAAKAIIVGDQDKLAEMIAHGQCSMIRKGVKVLVLEQPIDAVVGDVVNIRVQSGADAHASVFVLSKCLQPTSRGRLYKQLYQ